MVRRLEEHLREVLHLGATPLAALHLVATPLAVLPLEIPRQTARGLGGLPTARLTADGLRTALPVFSSICWTSSGLAMLSLGSVLLGLLFFLFRENADEELLVALGLLLIL